jgi:hypothetical protein
MKLPRASMLTTLFVILVFAVDFGVARDLLTHDRGRLSDYGLGILPMATALVFGLYRLVRLGGKAGAFTVGFVAAGLAASGGYLAAIRLVPSMNQRMSWLAQAMDDRLLAAFPPFSQGPDLGLDELLVLGTILSIPPGLLALAGGWVARRVALGRKTASHQRKQPRAGKRPRFTLGSTAILVAVLAVDFGLIRQLAVNGSEFWTLFGVGFLPIANALVLGLPGLFAGRRRRGPFLMGFEVAGWFATLSYLVACLLDPSAMVGRLQAFGPVVFSALDLVSSGKAQRLLTSSFYAGWTAEMILVVSFFSVPPLLIALFGGAISRRLSRRSTRIA